MGLKHGMKLAAISGEAGVFSDDDMLKVKELALKEIIKAKAQKNLEKYNAMRYNKVDNGKTNKLMYLNFN